MAVIVIVGVKDGTGIKKLIKKYAVMLNSLLSLICFLPSVHSSEDFSSSNYFDYSDDANRDAATIIGVTLPVTNSKATINKKTPLEIFGIVIASIVGIVGAITGCFTYWSSRSLRQGPPNCFQELLSCFQGPQGPQGQPGRF